jgi:ABC-type uncharacterized transport system permease subunit
MKKMCIPLIKPLTTGFAAWTSNWCSVVTGKVKQIINNFIAFLVLEQKRPVDKELGIHKNTFYKLLLRPVTAQLHLQAPLRVSGEEDVPDLRSVKFRYSIGKPI